MSRHSLAVAAALLIVLPLLSRATTMDPGIILDGTDPDFTELGGITNGLNGVQATSPDITYGLENDTGIIQSVTFAMIINTGLPNKAINNGFSCSQDSTGNGTDGYFLHCSVDYNKTTGALTFNFFGVKPPDDDELCPAQDCEAHEQEGIPPGASFFVHLTGWVDDASVDDPIQLYNGAPPTFTNSFTASSPEPSGTVAAGVGLLLVAAFVEIRRRRLALRRG